MELQKNTEAQDDSNLHNLLYCLRDYLQKHGDSGKPLELLRSLTSLTLDRLENGEDLKISSTALQVTAEGGIVADKSPGSALAGPWKNLTERIMIEREGGLQKFFSQHGHHQYLWPMKIKSSGGAGNTSMYFLDIRLITKTNDIDMCVSTTYPDKIHYIPEITPRPAWWLRRLLEGGYAFMGWRRWLLIGLGLASFLILVVFLVLTWLVFFYSKNLTLQSALSMVFSTVVIAWLSYSLIAPMVRLLNWRIIKAPDILVSLSENNVLIELVSNQQSSEKYSKTIRLVRYAGTCPICTAKVEVFEGGKEFPDRFVGRCQESPAEHVYSFDRVMLKGKLLR